MGLDLFGIKKLKKIVEAAYKKREELLTKFKKFIGIKPKEKPEDILLSIHKDKGLLWENIEEFKNFLLNQNGFVKHHTTAMEDLMPLKHYIKDGLYTREILMPKGTLVVSFIHKQNHPSFFMSGEMSILLDTGEVKRIKAPMIIQTEIGTQRVAYMHENCIWVCVYRVNSITVEEAEKEVYTENYRELPFFIINKKMLKEVG